MLVVDPWDWLKKDGSLTYGKRHLASRTKRNPWFSFVRASPNDIAEVVVSDRANWMTGAVADGLRRGAGRHGVPDRVRDVPLAPDRIHLRFRIRREAGGFLFDSRFADDQRVTDVGDDWLLVEATVPSTRELRRWLFGFAPYIEVIDPPQLREEVRGAARRLLERHGSASLATPDLTSSS